MTLADYFVLAAVLMGLATAGLLTNRRIAALESALADARRDLDTAGEIVGSIARDHGDALRNQAAMIRDHVEATTGRPWR